MSSDKLQKKFGSGGKILSRANDDVWVETLTDSGYGFGVPDAVSFHIEDIKRLRGIGGSHTLIELEKGEEYIVALPHAAVAAKIYEPQDGMVDFKPHAYTGKKDKLVAELREAFAAAAERKKYEDYESLTYRTWARSSQKNNFTEITFSGKDVDFKKISEGGSKMGGQCVTFTTHMPDGSAFGDKNFIVETTLAAFEKMVKAAVAAGQTELDMREYSLRKGRVFVEKRQEP